MRPPLHFDGAPNTFAQMRALFSPTSRLQVKWAQPKAWKFQLHRDAKGTPLTLRAWRLLGRKSA